MRSASGDKLDDGFIALSNGQSVADLIETCGALRHWDREAAFV